MTTKRWYPRALSGSLRLGWNSQTRNGFFLRSEDFFGVQKLTNALRDELAVQIAFYSAKLRPHRARGMNWNQCDFGAVFLGAPEAFL